MWDVVIRNVVKKCMMMGTHRFGIMIFHPLLFRKWLRKMGKRGRIWSMRWWMWGRWLIKMKVLIWLLISLQWMLFFVEVCLIKMSLKWLKRCKGFLRPMATMSAYHTEPPKVDSNTSSDPTSPSKWESIKLKRSTTPSTTSTFVKRKKMQT